jgi:hypothetical protein
MWADSRPTGFRRTITKGEKAVKKWSVFLIMALIIPVSLSFSVPAGACSGCTPGYWKQEQHFDSWVDYSPDDRLQDVFGPDVPDMSLLDALSAKNKDVGSGVGAALIRHAVAALLNDAAGLFDSDVQDWISWAWGDAAKMEEAKAWFEAANEGGCPLN